MRLELTEVLACPRCGPDHGLIAFVDQMDGRWIAAGRLDCPNCEERHPIREGIVFLRGSAQEDVLVPSCDPPEADLAELAGALLGVPTGPEILLVGPGLESVATSLADMRPLAAVIAYSDPLGQRHDRVHWIVPVPGAPLPIRSARLHGVVVAAEDTVDSAEAGRVLAPGCRLVILTPGQKAPAFLPAAPVRELASDSRAWVGVR